MISHYTIATVKYPIIYSTRRSFQPAINRASGIQASSIVHRVCQPIGEEHWFMPARSAPLFVASGQSCHKDNCRQRTTCCRGHIPFAAFYSYFMIIHPLKSISKCNPLQGIYALSMSISHRSSTAAIISPNIYWTFSLLCGAGVLNIVSIYILWKQKVLCVIIEVSKHNCGQGSFEWGYSHISSCIFW